MKIPIKFILSLSILFILQIPVALSANTRASALPARIAVLNQSLSLKENSGNEKNGFIAEYIPENEDFDNWTLMFATRLTPGKNQNPKSSALSLAKVINDRKAQGDIYANSMVLQAPDGKSVAVDFLASSEKYLEHNIWRYFTINEGLASFQIARRIYLREGKEQATTEFIKSIQSQRQGLLKEIMRADLPLFTGNKTK